MKLQMKAIKHAEFASEETYCYEGKVYLDGKLFAYVSNDGRGGADRLYGDDAFEGNFWDKIKEVDAYLKTLPNMKTEFGELEYTFELWCHEQVTDWLIRKDMKKMLSKNALFLADGKLMSYGYKGRAKPDARLFSELLRQEPKAKILNTMPEDEALKIFREFG